MKHRPLVFVLMLLTLLAGCGPGSGDRVLVSKFQYDSGIGDPERFDVVVFRFPDRPIKDQVPTNYIKRLMGLAGETIAFFFGNLFVCRGLEYPEDLEQIPDRDLWKHPRRDQADALKLFRESKFDVIRKPPAVMMALRRLVYDNDHPAKDLEGVLPPRWAPANEQSQWQPLEGQYAFRAEGSGEQPDWLRYRHILRPRDWPAEVDPNDPAYGQRVQKIAQRKHEPQLILDFSGYNSYKVMGEPREQPMNWVGDLMLECEVAVEKSEGEFWLELSQGVDRFQARWDLKSGRCVLIRKNEAGEKELEAADTNLSAPGTYALRFANFDNRLTVWIGRALPFGDGVNYEHAWRFDPNKSSFIGTGPTDNDLQPASVASKGAAVQVQHLKLWRDTYYTLPDKAGQSDAFLPGEAYENSPQFWGTPHKWDPLRELGVNTMYVQPGHYLCLGDNSPESSDSRAWGLVPDRLLLGRALAVYYPLSRAGLIR